MKILMWILLFLNSCFLAADLFTGQVDWSTGMSALAVVMLAFALDIDKPPA